MRHSLILSLAFSAMACTGASASDLTAALGIVSQAIAKGYGVDCDLEMRPNGNEAYYPCLDVGPYRFVQEYGRTRGFVVVPDQAPFEILLSDASGARYTVQGNWMTDLPGRVSSWWSTIGAVTAQPDRAAAAGDAVAAYLQSLEPTPAEQPAPAPAATPSQQPQIFYIVPPDYARNAPQPPVAQQQSIPSGLVPDPGGVLLAPGVVGYPPVTAP